jgi:phosphatidylserine decarboxylase
MKVTIEKDGFKFIIPAFLVGLIFLFIANFWPIGIFLILFAIAETLFFRQVHADIRFDENDIVSPASGKIIEIREVMEPDYIKGQAIKISIFMSVFDEHINYAPATGEVAYIKHRPGGFKKAYLDEASDGNEAQNIGFRNENSAWMIKQIAGVIARRIVCRCRVGDHLQAGEKLGLIRFGSRVELFFPLGTEFTVTEGQHIRGGRTIIGRLS